MKNKHRLIIGIVFLFFCCGASPTQEKKQEKDPGFITFVTDPKTIKFYWKDEQGQIIGSIYRLKVFVETRKQELKFAMNGGMYLKDYSPQGLYIENGVKLARLDTLSGSGNFRLKPNGVFYITSDNQAVVRQTKDFKDDGQIKFATQSGPMLIIDGQIHPAFIKGSANLNIRNGVGILPDNRVVFAMSKKEINFHDFAEYFMSLGCKNALYLDGFVSRTYLPEEKWEQMDGSFGVIIGVAE
jgi:uncharacterized protein YigE (DUF2233 family)